MNTCEVIRVFSKSTDLQKNFCSSTNSGRSFDTLVK